ncbi:MAG: hypothetical protein AMXMBFR33_06470 [Candidatus Xenobia bacterium]
MSKNLHTTHRLTSGDQDVVSLVNGFYYSGGPTPGVFQEYPFIILDESFTALAWNFVLAVKGSFLLGFAGPGWATGMFNPELVVGHFGDTTLTLAGRTPTSEAGFLIGAQLKFEIRVRITGWAGVRWVGGWDGYFENVWATIVDVNQQATIDFIALLLTAIEVLARRGEGGALADISKKLKPSTAVAHAGWGMTDSSTSLIPAAPSGNTRELIPRMTLKLDLSQFISPVRAFNEALSVVGSEVQFGPTFGFGFPIHIQVEGVVLDEAVYSVSEQTTDDTGLITYVSSQNNLIDGVPPGQIFFNSYRPATVGLRYKWSWGIDLTVGVYARITIFMVLSIQPQFTFGLLELLGIDTSVQGGVRGDLTNNSFTFSNDIAGRGPRPVEVVFEEPDLAWS